MKEEFERKIISKYRSMFPSEEIMSDETKSCLFWGFECGDGWETLLENLFEEISKANPSPEFKIAQIKSKFGGLRFYVDCDNEQIREIIRKYEDLSYNTCEYCGSSPATQTRGWITTLCKECYAKKESTH